MSRRDLWTDEDILTALDLYDHEGMTATAIAQRFGKSKGAVLGLFKRIRDEMNKSDPDGNQNGTMPRKWWKR